MSEFDPSTGDKKTRKAIRVARARGLKNFGWWLFGFLSSFIIVGGAAAVAVCAIPVGSYFGSDKDDYIGEDAGRQSLLNLILNYQNYSVSDFPLVSNLLNQILTSTGIDKYVTVDYDTLNGISLGEFASGSGSLQETLMGAIKVTATISNLGLTSQLGDLASLSAMTSWDVVTEEVDPNAEGFNPKLYYYQVDDTPTYARAYTDDTPALLLPEAHLPFYYPALVEVPLLDMFDIFGERLSTTTVTSLLSIFGALDSDSLVAKIMEGKTLGSLGSLSAADIKLTDVLELNDENATIYKILCAATGVNYDELKAGTATLTVDKLNGMNIDNIKLVDVLEKTADNEKIFDIICSAISVPAGEEKPDAEHVTLGHLKNIDVNNIKLSNVLAPAENSAIYDILSDLTNLEDNAITIGSLSSIEISNLHLTSVIANDSAHQATWDAILAVTGASNPDEVTIQTLENINVDNAKLGDFLKPEDFTDDSLMRLLVDAAGKADLAAIDAMNEEDGKAALKTAYLEIQIGELKSLNVDNIHLSSVIKLDANNILRKILSQGIASAAGDYYAIKIGDLENLDVNAINLSTVMPADEMNASMKKLLEDVCAPKTYDEISISDLKNVNISAAHVSSILDLSGNATLATVISQGTDHGDNGFEDVTIGELENLDINKVYLSSIMNGADQKLKDILGQASSKGDFSLVTVGDISNSAAFNMDNVKISTVLGTNENLLKILAEACNTTEDNLTVGTISNDFDVSRIKLQTVLSAGDVGDNKILQALYAKNPTISGLGSAMNSVTLYEAYGDSCFNTDSTKAATPAQVSSTPDKYSKSEVAGKTVYTYDPVNGTYYVDKTSSVWLLYCFEASDIDSSTGRVGTFTQSTKTLDALQTGSNTSEPLMNATIYTLITCGILEDSTSFKSSVTKNTLQYLINAGANALAMVP